MSTMQGNEPIYHTGLAGDPAGGSGEFQSGSYQTQGVLASNRFRDGSSQRDYPVNTSRMEQYFSLGLGAALGLAGLSRGRLSGLLLTAAGGGLLYRGLTGHCHLYDALGMNTAEHPDATAVPAQQGEHFETAIAINRPPEELFAFWRNVENLPQVMRHVKRVEPQSHERSRWTAEGPFGQEVQWEAEIINERENEMIAWRSLPGGDMETAGSVHFKPLPHERGTEVRVSLKYDPPGGKVGALVASLSGRGLKQEISEDLRNFKARMETGEIATAGSPPVETGGADIPVC